MRGLTCITCKFTQNNYVSSLQSVIEGILNANECFLMHYLDLFALASSRVVQNKAQAKD